MGTKGPSAELGSSDQSDLGHGMGFRCGFFRFALLDMHLSSPFRSPLAGDRNAPFNKKKRSKWCLQKGNCISPSLSSPHQMAYVKRSEGDDRWHIDIA